MTILVFVALFTILGVGMLLISVLRDVGQLIFGRSHTRSHTSYSQNERSHSHPTNVKKVFSENEGEYVKYEDLKD